MVYIEFVSILTVLAIYTSSAATKHPLPYVLHVSRGSSDLHPRYSPSTCKMIGAKIQGYLQAIVALHKLLAARCFVLARFGGEFKEAPGLALREDLVTLYY